jgi:hypothetical protein
MTTDEQRTKVDLSLDDASTPAAGELDRTVDGPDVDHEGAERQTDNHELDLPVDNVVLHSLAVRRCKSDRARVFSSGLSTIKFNIARSRSPERLVEGHSSKEFTGEGHVCCDSN